MFLSQVTAKDEHLQQWKPSITGHSPWTIGQNSKGYLFLFLSITVPFWSISQCCDTWLTDLTKFWFHHLVPVAMTCKNFGRRQTIYYLHTNITPRKREKNQPSKPFHHFPGYHMTIVLKSPVKSGFLNQKCSNRNPNWLDIIPRPQITGLNHH